MNHHSELSEVFRPHLQWHRARLDFLAAFVLALIRVRSVNLAQIAVALNPWVHIASNYRRCQRFLAGFSFDQETIGRLILQLLPQNPEQKLVLSLDRTEWKLGRLSINLLFIGVAHQGVAYPLVWCFLGKAGSSNLRERLGLLRRLLTFLPKARTGFLRYLRWRKVPYTLRIKAGSRVIYKGQSRPVQRLFRHLGKPCPNRFGCGGNPPIAEGEYLLLIRRPIPSRPLLDTPGAGRSKPSSGLRLRIHPPDPG